MAPTVLITGASCGSGKATAILFASSGYDVVMTARQPERLAAAAAQVKREGNSVLAIPVRDRNEPAAELRRQQMSEMLKSNWVSQPEDIAKAIWDAVKNKRNEITVGPAFLASEAYRLFPGLMQWAMEQR